jgi:hypothetical protein
MKRSTLALTGKSMHESSMLFLTDVGKDIWATLVKRVAKRSRGVHLSTVNFVDLKFIGMNFCKGRRERIRREIPQQTQTTNTSGGENVRSRRKVSSLSISKARVWAFNTVYQR